LNNNGIWIGENATVAIVDDYRISFLRLKKDLIVSILHHNDFDTVGVVYGYGVDWDAHAVVAAINPQSKSFFNSDDEAKDYITNHSLDKIECDNNKLTYVMYDGTRFNLNLAEKIDMTMFEKKNEIDNTLSLAEKMALWEIGKCFECMDGYFNVRIDTKQYSILFSFSLKDNWVYCRVGQNGYCEKGRAMLSTICIRQNETRMIENNLLSIDEYKPKEDCFVVDECSFPDDGGWYWSVKEVTDDVIYLNGCGDATYEIRRN